jgi:RimJ/RimL family protein N-acetyltransferase
MRKDFLETDRFIVRSIELTDANENYLSWFESSENTIHINTANDIRSLSDIVDYVKSRATKEDVLFLAIVLKETKLHIGNIKFEPLDFINERAYLGIFIGDPSWRNKGVFSEIFLPVTKILKARGIFKIYLGVKNYNLPALNAYLKTGFRIVDEGLITGQDGIELRYDIP